MIRNSFQNELDQLHKEVLKMGATLETTIEQLLTAFAKRDKEKLKAVMKRDDLIDDLEYQVEKKCIALILQQQPVADDLRNVTSVLKMITDIERMADHCTDIAQHLIIMIDADPIGYQYDVTSMLAMGNKVKTMVSDTIDVYIKPDVAKAIEIARSDDEIDHYFTAIAEELKQQMKANGDFVEKGAGFLYIIKYMERMADHATNVCEWVAYRITGTHKQYN